MLRAGTLNDRIVIQNKASTPDDFGQPVVDWADYAEVWANVRFQNGKEFLSSDKEVVATVASIRVRYIAEVTAQMRVLFRGQIYNISAVLPDSGRVYMDLAVTTGLNNG